MRLTFAYSHAFPGSRVSIEAWDDRDDTCLVEFADGVTVLARTISHQDDVIVVEIPSYSTATGHQVISKRWRIVRASDGDWKSQRSDG